MASNELSLGDRRRNSPEKVQRVIDAKYRGRIKACVYYRWTAKAAFYCYDCNAYFLQKADTLRRGGCTLCGCHQHRGRRWEPQLLTEAQVKAMPEREPGKVQVSTATNNLTSQQKLEAQQRLHDKQLKSLLPELVRFAQQKGIKLHGEPKGTSLVVETPSTNVRFTAANSGRFLATTIKTTLPRSAGISGFKSVESPIQFIEEILSKEGQSK